MIILVPWGLSVGCPACAWGGLLTVWLLALWLAGLPGAVPLMVVKTWSCDRGR